MSSANVRNIQALVDLKAALARFKSDAQASLLSAQHEIQRAQEWLAERERHWKREVQRCEELARQAQGALARCEASGVRDKEGRYYPPNCSKEERESAHAERQLRQTRAELETAQQAVRAVQQQAAEFQREAQRLTVILNNDVARATALLERKIAILQGYTGDTAPTAEEINAAVSAVVATATMSASSQASFRQAMKELSKQSRGDWGERAVVNEALTHGHLILLEHHGAATTPGYDSATWDGAKLHIWEAKNYSADEDKSSVVQELSALDQNRMKANVEQILRNLDNHRERSAIIEAIQQNRVQWHIRLGPDTDISFNPLDKLGWENVDVRQYSYNEMLQSSVTHSNDPTRPPMPREFKEGNFGGPERGG